jgi:hypothetical protein
MLTKELHEKMDTIAGALPETVKPDFADLMLQMAKWSANPTYVQGIRQWLRVAGYTTR